MMNEEISLVDHSCYICQKTVTTIDYDTLDETCFITVHKNCKKNYRGSCPVCHIQIKNEKCNKCMYTSILLTVSSLFATGIICFFVLMGEKI